MKVHFILYVKDQEQSKKFYSAVLNQEPTLHVPGMTEFELSDGCVLGLMPELGIKRLLGEHLPDPSLGRGIPRAELYLRVDNPIVYHERAIKMGAKELSGLETRDWGDIAAYSIDQDGHVIAFAKTL
ncbi:MAG: glyoxalase [Bdellovibrionales bacterium RIFOXYA1_FULL_36_14]|nr:MAG: glyoxalase [Bdellovibrionales bacterium RIFOXYA1_FULL_36_14]